VAPRLREYCEEKGDSIHRLERYGLVDSLEQHCTNLRTQAISEGVGSQAIAYLDLEIQQATRPAIEQKVWLDKNISLLDKLRDKEHCVEYEVIPGQKATTTYVFLLHVGYGMRDWVKLLERKGYGGSVIVGFINIDSGMYVAETGQCDALLLEQHGIRDKSDILDEAQQQMENAQNAIGVTEVPMLPKYIWRPDPILSNDEDRLTCGGFDRFLDQQFPLE